MKVVVTGGAGGLGTVTLRSLGADPQIKEIVSVDLRAPVAAGGKKQQVVIADMRSAEFARACEGADAVVHLAYKINKDVDDATYRAVNVDGSRQVFEAAIEAGVPQIVYTSSIAGYGVFDDHPRPVLENTPRRRMPALAYSATKYDVEEMLDAIEAAHPDLIVTRFRPAIVIGRYQRHGIAAGLRSRLMISGPRDVRVPLVWDEDVGTAVKLAVKQRKGGAFNLVASDQIRASEAARVAGARLIKPPRRLMYALSAASLPLSRLGFVQATEPGWVKAIDAEMVISGDKARRELGWRPKCETSTQVIERFMTEVPARFDPRLSFYFRALDQGAQRTPKIQDLERENMLIHLELTGRDGGDVTFKVGDGGVRVFPGLPRETPSATVIMSTDTLRSLLLNELDWTSASFMNRYRVLGSGHATMILGGIITVAARSAERKGLQGRLAGWLQALVRSGASKKAA